MLISELTRLRGEASEGSEEPCRFAFRQGGALAFQHRFSSGAIANFLIAKFNFESASSRPPNLHRDRGNAGIFAPAFSGSFLDIAKRRSSQQGHRSRGHGRDDADEHSPPRGPTFRGRLRSVPNFQCYREARGLPRVEPHGVCRRLPHVHKTATPSEH